LVDIY